MNSFLNKLKLKINFDRKDFDEANKDFFANDVADAKDKVAVLVHLIMVQQNFIFLVSDQCQDPTSRIEQIKSDLYNKISYNAVRLKASDQIIKLDSNILITILKSGNNLDIHLKYKEFNSVFLKVNLGDLFLLNQNLETFQVRFKDDLLNPLKLYLRTSAENINLINGLVDLPFEIVYKLCTTYLNVKTIMALSRSCRQINRLIFSDLKSSNSIWNKLIKRDFGIKLILNDASLPNSNYYQEYKNYFRKRKHGFSSLMII
jgi:hypothetical protein